MPGLLQRARSVLPASVPCAALTHEICTTELLPDAEALTLYRQARAAGLSALLVTPEALGDPGDLAAYEATSADAVLAARGGPSPAEIDAALDQLGTWAGRDPMTLLHRLSLDDLESVAQGELDPGELEELLLADDLAEAYRDGLAGRKEMLEWARAHGQRFVQHTPVRTYDEATALAELKSGDVRLVLAAAAPARLLFLVGYGSFNDCPEPHEHARVWELWGRTHGAEPVVVESDRVSGFVARPPATRAELVRFVNEIVAYDGDLLQDSGLLALAGRVYRNTHIGFWWD